MRSQRIPVLPLAGPVYSPTSRRLHPRYSADLRARTPLLRPDPTPGPEHRSPTAFRGTPARAQPRPRRLPGRRRRPGRAVPRSPTRRFPILVDAGFENQKELTKMQLDNQKEIAETQNETQKEIGGIQP